MPLPKIIPVIDLMGGRVVRAVGGRRSQYRPVQSVLTDSTEPGAVARAMIAATGASWLYVADLDAIVFGRPDAGSVEAIAQTGALVMCDGGFRSPAEADRYSCSRLVRVVGTETGSLDLLKAIGPSRCVVSLDLHDGRVVGDMNGWGVRTNTDGIGVLRVPFDLGVETVIVIELDRVGTGIGPGTASLVSAIKSEFYDITVLAGGGVRTWQNVRELGAAGADGVLVASALHDGTLIPPRQAEPW